MPARIRGVHLAHLAVTHLEPRSLPIASRNARSSRRRRTRPGSARSASSRDALEQQRSGEIIRRLVEQRAARRPRPAVAAITMREHCAGLRAIGPDAAHTWPGARSGRAGARASLSQPTCRVRAHRTSSSGHVERGARRRPAGRTAAAHRPARPCPPSGASSPSRSAQQRRLAGAVAAGDRRSGRGRARRGRAVAHAAARRRATAVTSAQRRHDAGRDRRAVELDREARRRAAGSPIRSPDSISPAQPPLARLRLRGDLLGVALQLVGAWARLAVRLGAPSEPAAASPRCRPPAAGGASAAPRRRARPAPPHATSPRGRRCSRRCSS